MRIPIIVLVVGLCLSFILDFYIWRVVKARFKSRIYSRRLQIVSAIVLWVFLAVAVSLPRRSGSDETLQCIMWMLFGYMTVYGAKLVFVVFDLISSVPRLWRGSRMRWLGCVGAIASILTFAAMWWGALINRYSHQIVEENIYIENLPDGFDGFRIVQISDLHTGTYGGDTTYLAKIVSIVNGLRPDVILFTGDIVNRHMAEIEPHLETLRHFKSPAGVYAVLGNHDYGDYSDWKSEESKQADFQSLIRHIRADLGWKLLLNEYAMLRAGGDSIALIGVENVGDPPFKTYGSLSRAYPTPGDSSVKILMTHNPAHWVDSIRNNHDVNIALTLSGHTHAMQMEVAGISPAALRYETWGGLYKDSIKGRNQHQLYVNIGIGTVGLPMRIGATPEITVLTLKKSKAVTE